MSSPAYFSCLGSWHLSDVPEESITREPQNDAVMPPSGSATAIHTAYSKILGDDGETVLGLSVILPKMPPGTVKHISATFRREETQRNNQTTAAFSSAHTLLL